MSEKIDTNNHTQENTPLLDGEMASMFLLIIAWLSLLGGFIGAYVIWKEFGIVDVARYGSASIKEYNYLAIWYSIAFFIGGVVWFTLLKVVVAIFKHTVEIRKNQT